MHPSFWLYVQKCSLKRLIFGVDHLYGCCEWMAVAHFRISNLTRNYDFTNFLLLSTYVLWVWKQWKLQNDVKVKRKRRSTGWKVVKYRPKIFTGLFKIMHAQRNCVFVSSYGPPSHHRKSIFLNVLSQKVMTFDLFLKL